MTVSKFCDRENVSVATFQYWRQRLAPQQPEQVSRLAAPIFQAVDLLSQRAVVIRAVEGYRPPPPLLHKSHFSAGKSLLHGSLRGTGFGDLKFSNPHMFLI